MLQEYHKENVKNNVTSLFWFYFLIQTVAASYYGIETLYRIYTLLKNLKLFFVAWVLEVKINH